MSPVQWTVNQATALQTWYKCRDAVVHVRTERVPCGECHTTVYTSPTGEIVRQDIAIHVSSGALAAATRK